jgi:hypothetical protein
MSNRDHLIAGLYSILEELWKGSDQAAASEFRKLMVWRARAVFWSDADPRGPVLAALHRLRAGNIRLGTIVVDTVGIGYNFALHLADQGFPCYGFNAGARPIDAMQFVNQKAEAHSTFRSHLQKNLISGLTDEETAAQLSTIRYRENSRGLTEIESKEQRNQRGIPGSPRIGPSHSSWRSFAWYPSTPRSCMTSDTRSVRSESHYVAARWSEIASDIS